MQDTTEELVLQLEDAFVRLQAHGLAEFHRLLSRSWDRPEGRATTVRRRPEASAERAPEITCADILMALQVRVV